MEKIINIDGKDIKFKSTGATLIRYKSQFHRDGLKDLMQIVNNMATEEKNKNSTEEEKNKLMIENLDLDAIYRFAWVFAKTADKDIPLLEEWLDSFDDFPIIDISLEVLDLITSTLSTSKKK